MSERVETIKAFAEIFFSRCDRATKDLTEKEIEWRPVEESNNIRWILTHLSRQWNVGIPRILKGDPEYKPEGWPEDYAKSNPSLEKLMSDLGKGKTSILSGLEGLTAEDLDAEIPLWRGRRKRQVGLMMYLSEALHHEGQIAYLRGVIGRRRQKDEHFLV